jgi:hypothetical protein
LDLAEFTVMTPFPHTKGFDDFHRQGRIFDYDWNHYNAGQVVFQPKQMSPERLQELNICLHGVVAASREALVQASEASS